jgi:folate-binding protein YgfZ
MTSLSYLSVIKASGEDSRQFLQGQLAADISELKIGQSGFAAYCNAKGQVIALTLVICRDSDFLIICEKGLARKVLDRLNMFVLRAKVKFDLKTDMGMVGINPAAQETSDLPTYKAGGSSLRYAIGQTPSPNDALSNDWHAQELSRGIAWLNQETSERSLPQMLGFDKITAVSFSKGCYPGQEIIARTRYLGKLKRKRLIIEVDGQPDSTPGIKWSLNCGEKSVEATLVESARSNTTTIAVLVGPVLENEEVYSVEVKDICHPAQQVNPIT